MTPPPDAPTPPLTLPPPPGWGDDPLSEVLEKARRNQWATFHNRADIYAKLRAFNELFRKVGDGWQNPDNAIAALLLYRCHSAFIAATGLAMAGQATEMYPLCRSMLEYAAYAVHISRNPQLTDVLIGRSEPGGEEAVRQAFTHRKVLASVTAADAVTGARFEHLYDRTIEWGAHPNELAIIANLAITGEPGGTRTMEQTYVHEPGKAFDHALLTVLQCAMCSLDMLKTVFPDRFKQLGVDVAMNDLKAGR